MEKGGFSSFLLGLGVGIGIGMLFAPKAGADTRQFTLAQSRRREGHLCRIIAAHRIRMERRTPRAHTAGEISSRYKCRRVGATGASAVASRKAGEQFYCH